MCGANREHDSVSTICSLTLDQYRIQFVALKITFFDVSKVRL